MFLIPKRSLKLKVWITPRNVPENQGAKRWGMDWWSKEMPNFNPWKLLFNAWNFQKISCFADSMQNSSEISGPEIANSGPEIWRIHPPPFHAHILLAYTIFELFRLWIWTNGMYRGWIRAESVPWNSLKIRRAPDYSSNLCPPKIWSIWLF